MNALSFNILPNPGTYGHEVRVFIDGEDLFGKDYLGLDPAAFFDQANFYKTGYLMIGRCICGCEGCCDFPVNVIVNDTTVQWTNKDGLNLLFYIKGFATSIEAIRDDYILNKINISAERIANDILKDTQLKNNYSFDYANARAVEKKLVLSFSKEDDQKLFYIIWDGQTEASAEGASKKFFDNRFNL